jgi:hypothetical protein
MNFAFSAVNYEAVHKVEALLQYVDRSLPIARLAEGIKGPA